MNTTQHSAKPSQFSRAIGSTLVAAALLLNMGMAQAASDTMANESAKAVNKTERVVSDSWITAKVKSEILANSVSKAFKVSVKTKYGMVRLAGTLPSQDAIDLVKLTAENVKGVKGVDVSGLVIGS
jgi:hyperosmotically inducible protein